MKNPADSIKGSVRGPAMTAEAKAESPARIPLILIVFAMPIRSVSLLQTILPAAIVSSRMPSAALASTVPKPRSDTSSRGRYM